MFNIVNYLIGSLLFGIATSSYRINALEFPQSEYSALYDLYNATSGATWNWLKPYATKGNPWTFETQVNPCTDSWQGIVCSISAGQYHVTQIALASFGLHGTIPSTISDLPELQVLDLLQNHQNTGTIPTSMGHLLKLQRLELSENNLQGDIPSTFSQLSQLLSFQVDSNRLFGPLPDFLCGLTQLESLTATSNHFTGTIPTCLGNLSSLQVLALDDNLFYGPIPASFGNLTRLERLSLQKLRLTGTIPATLGNMTQLHWLYVAYNELSGTLPSTLYNLTALYSIGVTDNALSGSIPASIAHLTQLHTFALDYNHFSGPVTDSLYTIQSLVEVTLNGNAFTGSISEKVGDLPLLEIIDWSSNRLTGTLPASLWNMTTLAKLLLPNNLLWGPLPVHASPDNVLNYVELSSNHLSGFIPDSIGSLSQIYDLALDGNRLVGTIPSILGNLSTLEELDLSDNELTGTIPSSLQYLGDLSSLSLQGNQLRGSLNDVINATQTVLSNIQLDNNQFTGELPSVLFELRSLISLSIVGSCLHGTVPSNICNATRLEALILQGLTTGASCRSAVRTFGGTVPECLLSMSTLQTVLLSSNSFKGTIRVEKNTVGKALVQLDLSHNLLTGSIPVALQNHTWSLLDLSHNKLSGVLSTHLHAPHLTYFIGNVTSATTYPKLALDTNRLSGPVPNSVKQLQSNLSVLAGNLFQCRYDKTDLPQHDSDVDKYECASNSFNLSMYLWIGTFVASIGLLYVYYRLYSHRATIWTLSELQSVLWTTKLPNLCSVLSAHRTINQGACGTALFCVVILLPYYAIISQFGGTHTHQYAYVLSAIYTSGVVSFTLTFTLLGVLLSLVWWLLVDPAVGVPITSDNNEWLGTTQRRYLFLCTLYALTNMTMVLGINIAFVYIVLYESSEAQTIAQVALSVFKLVWSMEVSPYMMRKLDAYFLPDDSAQPTKHRHNYFTLQLLVGLFNNIAIPCLVVMAIDPNCFSDVLLPPKEETVNYVQSVCERNLYRGACFRQSYRVASLQYTPPFTYSYQCSASFITSYAPAFVYMSISNAVVHPLVQYVLVHIYGTIQKDSIVHQCISRSLPRLLKIPTVDALESLQQQRRSLVGATGTLVTLFTQLGILLTFGAIFPPVALAMAVSIASIVYLTRFKVQRFVQAAVDAQLLGYLDVINAECAGVGTRAQMQLAIKIIVCYCCAFYMLFLFDTLGDTEGFKAAAWVLIVVPLLPLGFFSSVYIYSHHGRHINSECETSSVAAHREVELGSVVDFDRSPGQQGSFVVNSLHKQGK